MMGKMMFLYAKGSFVLKGAVPCGSVQVSYAGVGYL